MKQDGITSETSDVVPIIVNTTNGEQSFLLTTKHYVDKFVYDVLQMILEFTNNSGTELWIHCDLEVAVGMSSFAGFFKASDSITPSTGTRPDTLPPIGSFYAFIEGSTPNNGVDRYAHITYTK